MVAVAGRVGAVEVEPAGTALVFRPGRAGLERLQLDARRRSTVADLRRAPGFGRRAPSTLSAIAALDDGAIAVAAGHDIWRLRAGGSRRLTLPRDVARLVRLPGGAFGALLTSGNLLVVERDGAPRMIASGVTGGFTVTSDGRMVGTTEVEGRPALTLIGRDGTRARQEWDATGLLGGGEGVALRGLPWRGIVSAAVATDDSLLFATRESRIRAVVPADSQRPRVAITQPTFDSARSGRIGYYAGVPGRLALDVQPGARRVADPPRLARAAADRRGSAGACGDGLQRRRRRRRGRLRARPLPPRRPAGGRVRGDLLRVVVKRVRGRRRLREQRGPGRDRARRAASRRLGGDAYRPVAPGRTAPRLRLGVPARQRLRHDGRITARIVALDRRVTARVELRLEADARARAGDHHAAGGDHGSPGGRDGGTRTQAARAAPPADVNTARARRRQPAVGPARTRAAHTALPDGQRGILPFNLLLARDPEGLDRATFTGTRARTFEPET